MYVFAPGRLSCEGPPTAPAPPAPADAPPFVVVVIVVVGPIVEVNVALVAFCSSVFSVVVAPAAFPAKRPSNLASKVMRTSFTQ